MTVASVMLTGRLNMLTATIDWRNEVARCVGVFRSEEQAAMEVEYTIHLDDELLDLLAKAFLQAGVPVLRGSEAATPAVTLVGDTLSEFKAAEVVTGARQKVQRYNMDGTPRLDRRTRAGKEQERMQTAAGRKGGGNGTGEGSV